MFLDCKKLSLHEFVCLSLQFCNGDKLTKTMKAVYNDDVLFKKNYDFYIKCKKTAYVMQISFKIIL